jgi:ParB family chromosome partitioning protein
VVNQIIVRVQILMDSSLTSLTDILLGQPLSVFSQVDPRLLRAHPRNSSIYGEENVTELVELIRQSGWVKPLVITSSFTIISGHRRWKAVLELGWLTVPVEVREYRTEEEELEALLLENASRFKTTEQKVREAEAWKSLEQTQARKRMSQGGQKSASGKPVDSKGVENFPHLSLKGKTRDRLAKLVGLGSGRNYSKAAKVVEAIDHETSLGNLKTAQALRQMLNSKSVDAAVKLLKHSMKGATATSLGNSNGRNQASSAFQSQSRSIQQNTRVIELSPESREGTVVECNYSEDSYQVLFDGDESPKRWQGIQLQPLTSNQSGTTTDNGTSSQCSCWNCWHRGELIGNDSFYCDRMGTLSLLEQDANTRGASCNLWREHWCQTQDTTPSGATQATDYTLTLSFPPHLQSLFEDAARAAEMSVVEWVHHQLKIAALSAKRANQLSERGQN